MSAYCFSQIRESCSAHNKAAVASIPRLVGHVGIHRHESLSNSSGRSGDAHMSWNTLIPAYSGPTAKSCNQMRSQCHLH